MLTDPLSVTYNGSAKSLPRVGMTKDASRYRTADGEFEVFIASNSPGKSGKRLVSVRLARTIPDPTPSNSFDDYREIVNSFAIYYGFDVTRDEASVDLPRLRTALLNWVDSTLEGRLISGEK
jgi:hypothetical protein